MNNLTKQADQNSLPAVLTASGIGGSMYGGVKGLSQAIKKKRHAKYRLSEKPIDSK